MTEPKAPRAAQHAQENAEAPEDQYDEERAPAAKQARDNAERKDPSSTPPDQR